MHYYLIEKKNLSYDAMLKKLWREEEQINLSKQKLDARNQEIRETLKVAEQRALDVVQEVTTEREVIEALRAAYSEAFGEAEVNKTTREVTEKALCWRCNGDGGAAGQCVSCDGTGMFNETTRVTEFKAMLINKI